METVYVWLAPVVILFQLILAWYSWKAHKNYDGFRQEIKELKRKTKGLGIGDNKQGGNFYGLGQ